MRFLLFVLLSLVAGPLTAACQKHTHSPVINLESYYQSASELTGSDLHRALNKIISGHTRYSYTCVWDILKEADETPNQPDSVTGIYTQRSILKVDRDNGSNNQDSWNREHIWAKSHGFPKHRQHAYTDAHHIRAADRSVNSDRSDHDFDNGGQPDSECSNCREGHNTWEPPDIVKGDIARMMFYMAVRYDGNDGSGTPDLQLHNSVDTPRSKELFGHFGKLCTLLGWHENDPVSSIEQQRNTVVHSWQGNRNPFIDKPAFAQAIWGRECNTDPTPVVEHQPGNTLSPAITLEALRQRLDELEREVQMLRIELEGHSRQ